MDVLTIMVDEVGNPVGHHHCQDDAKQVVNASRALDHENHKGDGGPEMGGG